MPNDSQDEYVTFKEFIALNPVLKDKVSTVRRWIRDGKLPHCQPGGPKTTILIPTDALQRMERGGEQARAVKARNDSKPATDSTLKAVRQPNWKKGLKQTHTSKD